MEETPAERTQEQQARFHRIKAAIHEAVFDVLRHAPRDPWDEEENQLMVRKAISSHISGSGASMQGNGSATPATPVRPMPHFSKQMGEARIEQALYSRLRVAMAAESTYVTFREVITRAESVRASETAAERLRTRILRLKPSLDGKTISDQIFELEVEEGRLESMLMYTEQGVRDESVILEGDDKYDKSLAFFAAISVQPVLRAVIETAFDDAWSVSGTPVQEEAAAVVRRLQEEGGRLNDKDLFAAKQGLEALEIRGKAMASLVENMQCELEAIGTPQEDEAYQRLSRQLERKQVSVDAGNKELQLGIEKAHFRAASNIQAVLRMAVARKTFLDYMRVQEIRRQDLERVMREEGDKAAREMEEREKIRVETEERERREEREKEEAEKREREQLEKDAQEAAEHERVELQEREQTAAQTEQGHATKKYRDLGDLSLEGDTSEETSLRDLTSVRSAPEEAKLLAQDETEPLTPTARKMVQEAAAAIQAAAEAYAELDKMIEMAQDEVLQGSDTGTSPEALKAAQAKAVQAMEKARAAKQAALDCLGPKYRELFKEARKTLQKGESPSET